MALPTTGSQTELDAVNTILSTIGQAPVTSLDQTNPDVSIVYDTLTQTTIEVQAEGWAFNKEYDYKFSPDVNKEIKIPNNVLQLELSDDRVDYIAHDAVRRNGKLYNRTVHTFEWDIPVLCDVLWKFDWLDLPIPIQNYIVARSASLVSTKIVGDPEQQQMIQQNEIYTRSIALEYECNQGDYTFFGSPRGGNFYNSYQPYKALYR